MAIGMPFSPVGSNGSVTAGTASDTITFNAAIAADLGIDVVRVAVVGDPGDAAAVKLGGPAATTDMIVTANNNPQIFQRGAATSMGVIAVVGTPIVYAQLGIGNQS